MIRSGDNVIITMEDIAEASKHANPAAWLQEKLFDVMIDILNHHVTLTAEEALHDCMDKLRCGEYKLIEAEDYIKAYNIKVKMEGDKNGTW